MSRKRMISPSWAKHADLYDAEVSSGLPLRVAFAALWTVTDRRGVFQWSRNLKPDVLPYDACDMLAVLDALAAAQFVVRYEVDGKVCGHIPSFAEHQHFHRSEKPSTLPAPPEPGATTVAAPSQPGGTTAIAGKTTTSNGRHTAYGIRHTASTTLCPPPAADEEFDAAWKVYPKRAGSNNRAKARKAWRARRTAGIPASDLLAGLARYTAYLRATGKEGTEFVLQAATFFGPDRRFDEPWPIPLATSPPPAAEISPFRTPEMLAWIAKSDAEDAQRALERARA